MISIQTVKVNGKNCLGLRVELPDSPPLLLIIANKGFMMCGLLNIEAAEKLGATAVMVSGVKTLEDMQNAQIKAMTTKAKDLGIEAGMKGTETLEHML